MEFLRNEVREDERICMARNYFQSVSKAKEHNQFSRMDTPTAAALLPVNQRKIGMMVHERRQAVIKGKTCLVCLGSGHVGRNCQSFVKCTSCKQKHETILCDSSSLEKKVIKDRDLQEKAEKEKVVTVLHHCQYSSEVYLKTLLISVSSRLGT